MNYDPLFPGDPVPWFRERCIGQDAEFSFDMAAGRFVVLCFYGAAADPASTDALASLQANENLFDPAALIVFGISNDPADEFNSSLAPRPAQRHFADFEGRIAGLFGVAPRRREPALAALRRAWFVLDTRLRVIAIFPLDAPGNAALIRFLQTLPTPAAQGAQANLPVLTIPHVFEPDFCRRLMAFHQATQKIDSAVLTEGTAITDHAFKRRTDCHITDPALAAQAQTRIFRRVVPEIRHVFQFEATRLERLIIACYDATEGGRFGPHRDNTVRATAHRRFAVSLTLNDDFVGGGLSFPEYGSRHLQPQPGGALVFSCSLLHAVAPVTQGRRYACLPFVYDDGAAALRRGSKP